MRRDGPLWTLYEHEAMATFVGLVLSSDRYYVRERARLTQRPSGQHTRPLPSPH